jgi:DNA-binding CsgD family transcriptional regulator
MSGPTPPAVPLSEAERRALHTLLRAHKTPQHLSFRAQVILLLAEGLSAPDVARRLGTTRTTVRRWRRHWLTRHGAPIPDAYTTPRDQEPRPPSAPNNGARSLRWLVNLRTRLDGPSAIGPRVNWLPRPDNAGLWRPSRRAMADVF